MLLCPAAWFSEKQAMHLGLTNDALTYSLAYVYSDTVMSRDVANVEKARDDFFRVYNRLKSRSLLDYYQAILPDLELEGSNRSSGATYSCRNCKEKRAPKKKLLDHRLCYSFSLKPVERDFGKYSSIRSVYLKFTNKALGIMQGMYETHIKAI